VLFTTLPSVAHAQCILDALCFFSDKPQRFGRFYLLVYSLSWQLLADTKNFCHLVLKLEFLLTHNKSSIIILLYVDSVSHN
jgi:hypothetical protein